MQRPRKLKPLLMALAGCGLALGSSVQAATFSVTNTNDSGPGSLRQAISAANGALGADTVQFNLAIPATIVLTSGQIDVTESVALQGPGNNGVTISGNDNGRIFDVVDALNDDVYVNLSIAGLTLRDGRVTGENGGCIRSENVSEEGFVTLTDSIVTACQATASEGQAGIDGGLGGAIFSNGSAPDKYENPSVLATNSTISGNTATLGGGGVFGDFVRLDASVVSDNTVAGGTFGLDSGNKYGFGGGVAAGLADINDSTISGNTVMGISDGIGQVAMGGGIGVGAAYILDSTVSGNAVLALPGAATFAYMLGGGIGAFAGLVMANSTISGNTVSATPAAGAGAETALVSGGGVLTSPKYGFMIANSTISGNSLSGSNMPDANNYLSGTGLGVVNGGSGAKATGGKNVMATLAAAALSRIAASGIDLPSRPSAPGDLVLSSTIVANSIGGADVDCTQFGKPCVLAITGTNNLVESAGSGVTLPADTLAADPRLGALADNGGTVAGALGGAGTGSVKTHALIANSPALNTGNNDSGLVYDQRGPDYPRVKGSQADIGAFEGTIPIPSIPGLGPMAMGLLSGLLAVLGWRRRPR